MSQPANPQQPGFVQALNAQQSHFPAQQGQANISKQPVPVAQGSANSQNGASVQSAQPVSGDQLQQRLGSLKAAGSGSVPPAGSTIELVADNNRSHGTHKIILQITMTVLLVVFIGLGVFAYLTLSSNEGLKQTLMGGDRPSSQLQTTLDHAERPSREEISQEPSRVPRSFATVDGAFNAQEPYIALMMEEQNGRYPVSTRAATLEVKGFSNGESVVGYDIVLAYDHNDVVIDVDAVTSALAGFDLFVIPHDNYLVITAVKAPIGEDDVEKPRVLNARGDVQSATTIATIPVVFTQPGEVSFDLVSDSTDQHTTQMIIESIVDGPQSVIPQMQGTTVFIEED